jgi:hypothetical protein
MLIFYLLVVLGQTVQTEQRKKKEGDRQTKGEDRKKDEIGLTKLVREDKTGLTKLVCPDCELTFSGLNPLFIHATSDHYKDQMTGKYFGSIFDPELSINKCFCCEFETTNWETYLIHIGRKHKKIYSVMEREMAQKYKEVVFRVTHENALDKNVTTKDTVCFEVIDLDH